MITVFHLRPNTGFSGMAYVNYVVCDTFGTCASGQVSICVIDPNDSPVSDTVRYVTAQNVGISILLPGSEYELNQAPSNGAVDSLASDVVLYTPDLDYHGQDTFQMMNIDSVTRTVVVKILHVPSPNGFAIDDYVYTTRNKLHSI